MRARFYGILIRRCYHNSSVLSALFFPAAVSRMPQPLAEHVEKWTSLIKKERQAELDQFNALLSDQSLAELCAAGTCLARLHVKESRSALGGRTIVQFGKKNDRPLPAHKFSPGGPICIAHTADHLTPLFDGVVSNVSEDSIGLCFDRSQKIEELKVPRGTFAILPRIYETTFQRLMQCLNDLQHRDKFPGCELVDFAFHGRMLPTPNKDEMPTLWYDDRLNDPQKAAVAASLNPFRPITVVHGPPGTGKTRTVVELIRQSVANGQKVLLCAPSNVAVDNVVERLGPHVNLIRMGHPARSHSSLVKYSFDAALDASDHAPVLKDIRGELRGLEASAGPFAERRMHQLRAELRKREKKATQDVLKSTDVVCSTLITASNSLLTGLKFDLVVIDECAQSTELACWIGLLQGRRCVLAGDHCQLPPTIISEEAAREGLSISLMDRLSSDFADLADPFFRLLSIQYRMNDAIMKWASDGFYEGRLISDVSVAQHSLKDLSKSEFDDDICEEKVCIIDTNGCDMPELSTESDESKGNLGEAKIAYVQVKRLIDAGIAENVIAVISPYNLQVQFLRSCIGRDFPKVAIRSVDGFQGQEREALVLSLVRSNDQGVVGFLSDKRRINVAVTRARRHLCVICDTETVSNEPVIKSLVDYITDKGMVRSALEYDQDELDAVNLEIDTDDLQLPASDTKKPQAQKQQQPTTASSKQPKYGSRPSRKEAASYSLDATVKNPKEGLSATSLEGEHPSDWKVELTAQVDWFEMASTESTLTFPSNLSASQRRFLHEIADSRGLAHSSVGEGDQRQIVLEKKRPVNDVPVVVHNPPLRPVKDEREKTETAPSKSAKKTTTKKSRNVADAEEHYDVNELIAEIVDKESRCSFGHCSRSVGMLGVLCNYCRRRFCLTHAQAEIHGCGTLAQAEAKKQFRHQMSSGAPSQQKKLTGPNRDYVQRKLDDKLKKMQDERASGKKK